MTNALGAGVTVEETLRAMLDGWTEDKWIKHVSSHGARRCLLSRYAQISGNRAGRHDRVVRWLGEVVGEQWPERAGADDACTALVFNDHPDTTFADVVALVEKAAALAAERGL